MANKNTGSKKSASTKKTTTKKVDNAVNKTTKTTPKQETVKVKPETKVEVKQEVTIKKNVNKENNITAFIKENSRNLILGVICVLLIANIIMIVLGHQVKLENGKEVIASIDGKKYTAEDLFDKLKGKYGSDSLIALIDEYISSKELSNDDITKARKSAQEYVDNIKKQYESAGYKWEDILKQYDYTSEEALINEYLVTTKAEAVAKKYIEKDLTDEEIKKYYDENIYGNYTVKHILIKPETTETMTAEEKTAAEETAKNKAQEVINKYAAGESWATLVSTYSNDEGSKDEEGLIENFTKGDVVDEFFKASIALSDGKYTTEPVKSEYGYHVILKVSSTEKPSLKDSKNNIKTALVDKKLNDDTKLYNSTWVNIRKKYKLEINDTTVKNSYEKTISE